MINVHPRRRRGLDAAAVAAGVDLDAILLFFRCWVVGYFLLQMNMDDDSS